MSTVAPAKTAPIKNKVVELNLSDIIPTKDNTRSFDGWEKNPALLRMAENIRQKGILQPILVRKHPTKEGKYDLRAGERRYRASKLAGLKKIPALVLVLSNEEAQEVTIIENLHREDLTPMESARGIEKLLASQNEKWTVKAIAGHLGMTPSMVFRRARLTALSEKWQKAWAKPLFPSWGTGHYESIARFDVEVQDSLLEDMYHGYGRYDDMTLPELEKFLAGRTRFIERAPWDPKDETLLPEAGACSRCVFRSGCKPGLFDELYEPEKAGKKDRCLNLDCWEKKDAAQHERTKAELQKKHPGLAVVSSRFNHQRPGELPGKESYDLAKKGEKGAYLALVDDGEEKGKLIYAKPKKEATKKAVQALSGKEPGPTPLKERRAVYTKRRNVHVLDALVEKVKAGEGTLPALEVVLTCAAVFGTIRNTGYADKASWEAFDELAKGPTPGRVESLWQHVAPVVAQRLKSASASSEPDMDEAERWAGLLKIDLQALQEAAKVAIPDPKVWETLNEDGTPKKGGKKA